MDVSHSAASLLRKYHNTISSLIDLCDVSSAQIIDLICHKIPDMTFRNGVLIGKHKSNLRHIYRFNPIFILLWYGFQGVGAVLLTHNIAIAIF